MCFPNFDHFAEKKCVFRVFSISLAGQATGKRVFCPFRSRDPENGVFWVVFGSVFGGRFSSRLLWDGGVGKWVFFCPFFGGVRGNVVFCRFLVVFRVFLGVRFLACLLWKGGSENGGRGEVDFGGCGFRFSGFLDFRSDNFAQKTKNRGLSEKWGPGFVDFLDEVSGEKDGHDLGSFLCRKMGRFLCRF